MFDDPETVLAVGRLDPRFLQRAEHVHAAGILGGLAFDGGIAVHADEIQHRGHVKMVEATGKLAKIVRDGNSRRQFVKQIGLHLDEGDDRVAGEAHPIE